MRRAGSASTTSGEPFSCPEDVLEAVVEGLAACEETVLSETVCGGILDPNEVVTWVDAVKRLLRFRVDPAELRSEVPAVANGLHQLLLQVELPEPATAEALTVRLISRLVDLRAMLSADDFRQLWVPPGFAHGFCVTSEVAEFEYKCTDFYHPEDELVVAWNDPAIGVDWPVREPRLSARDAAAPRLDELGEGLPVFEG